MNTTIDYAGHPVLVDFSDGVLHTSGEFAGNLDFSVKFSESVPAKAVLKNLRVKFPGTSRQLEVAGYGKSADGLEITIYSELAEPGHDVSVAQVPPTADAFWIQSSSDVPVGTLTLTPQP